MAEDVEDLLQRRRYDEALERLLDSHEQRVFRMAVAMLRDRGRAQEVTQDIFLKLWRALPSYDGRAALSTWLYTIARNTCLNAVRAETYRRSTAEIRTLEPRVESIRAENIALHRAIDKLPEVQRTVLRLFYFEDRNIAEVASLLGMPEGTIKNHLHRARRTLSEMLE
ncbi:MAG: RNA polymerase sigma factor [Vicinamibacterales bacterium]